MKLFQKYDQLKLPLYGSAAKPLFTRVLLTYFFPAWGNHSTMQCPMAAVLAVNHIINKGSGIGTEF